MKDLHSAADFIDKNYWIGGRKPVVNDELAYEGAGDGWSEEDTRDTKGACHPETFNPMESGFLFGDEPDST
jgi:hypothetical protein